MRSFIVSGLLALLAGCPALTARDVDLLSDQDGDGVVSEAYGGDDCNDRAPTVFPDAPERCDEFDNDCDGAINTDDDDAVGVDWFRDADHDGFPDQTAHDRTCADLSALPDEPWVRAPADGAWDCDDQDGDEFPGQVWRFDGDGDGFAVPTATVREQCDRPSGFIVDVLDGGGADVVDCDDLSATVFPGQREVCNGLDDDCDDLVDDVPGEEVQGVPDYFPDDDGDGFGRTNGRARFCTITAGWVPLDDDCDDGDGEIHPGARNIPYNGVDEDCTDSDEDFDQDTYDSDVDCDDTAPWIHPEADDICDGVNDETCAVYTPSEASDEVGAFFIGPPNPSGTSPRNLVVRGYSDLRTPLGQGDLVTLPGDGTVFLCKDADWQGSLFGLGDSFVVKSPQAQPAHLVSASSFGNAISISAVDVEVSNLEIEGVVELSALPGGTILVDDLTIGPDLAYAYGALNLYGGDPVTVRRTTLTGPDATFVYANLYPEGDVEWLGNTVESGVVLVNRFYATETEATATFGPQGHTPSTFGTATIPGQLSVTLFTEVVLTDVVFTEAPPGEANLSVQTGTVEATNITFGAGTDVRFGQVTQRAFNFLENPTSFDCTGSGVGACLER